MNRLPGQTDLQLLFPLTMPVVTNSDHITEFQGNSGGDWITTGYNVWVAHGRRSVEDVLVQMAPE